jgi:hypothetical protein
MADSEKLIENHCNSRSTIGPMMNSPGNAWRLIEKHCNSQSRRRTELKAADQLMETPLRGPPKAEQEGNRRRS